jgi:hypothetical protein
VSARRQALNSLHEAGLGLIRVHLLDAPFTLHGTLLSTNVIENMISNFRRSRGRLNRWQPEMDSKQGDGWRRGC